MRIFAGFVVSLVLLMLAGAGYLYVELDQRTATLADTKTTLSDTRVVLQRTDQSLAAQVAQNADLQQANNSLQSEKAATEEANTTLTANLEDALDAIDEWQMALADRDAELSTANSELERTESELAETAVKLTLSRNSLNALTAEHRALQSSYGALLTTEATLRQSYNTLAQQSGDVESLQDKAQALREEIAELEVRRRPLILSVGRSAFACTGSMEPKITCLDEATWVDNPRPEEIVVGAVISFSPGCGDHDEENPSFVAHRVMDIKVEDAVFYYWPKGDANDAPDGCWVPFSSVEAYIVELHKDVRPENAGLRDSVNGARERADEARSAFQAAEAEYDAIIERYCGVGVAPNDCALPSPQYEIAISAHRDYVYALEVWSVLDEHYRCWLDSASTAISREGEPPLYLPCRAPFIPPPPFN